MRIAITGASGFVGQHVLRELQSRGMDIVLVTRSMDHVDSHSGNRNRVLIDVADCGLNPFEKMGSPDTLIHLAWHGLPNYQSPHHVETELPVQLRFLESCIKGGLKRLVVAGTCLEYGLISGELKEETRPQPCTQYGKAKDVLRAALETLHHEYDFELAWMRLFYLFGDGQSRNSIYSLLQDAIRRGERTFDMSGGEQIRDFLPIQEAARLMVNVSLAPGNVGIVNVCSSEPTTIRALVQRWIDQSGSQITMNLGQLPYPDTEPMAFWGSRARLNALLRDS